MKKGHQVGAPLNQQKNEVRTCILAADSDPHQQELQDLADKVNEEHAAAKAAYESALGHAIRCGQHLKAAKAAVGHGNWHAWVRENCKFTARTASNYMLIYANRKSVSEMGGVGEAVEALRYQRYQEQKAGRSPTPLAPARVNLKPKDRPDPMPLDDAVRRIKGLPAAHRRQVIADIIRECGDDLQDIAQWLEVVA